MSLRRSVTHILRRCTHRVPILRQIPTASLLLLLVWIYVLYRGERSQFSSQIEACTWNSWESWPEDARPHRMVLVADPQLVDPHTYPGRPYPLDVLTEIYTDRYMRRSFRMINAQLDPDSIVFLGDLFDGGREWATNSAPPLSEDQRKALEDRWKSLRGAESDLDLLETDHASGIKIKEVDPVTGLGGRVEGRDIEQREEQGVSREFVPGENGRWAQWGMEQWYSEYDRFGDIFLTTEQLYPRSNRKLLATFETQTSAANIDNGAENMSAQEYATSGGKLRHVRLSLPGNHDVGIGSGVQIPVRERFEGHYGEGNSVYVLGNHTFVSLDTPSLSAYSEFTQQGETSAAQRAQLRPIWGPAHEFLETLDRSAAEAVSGALRRQFDGTIRGHKPHAHEVVGTKLESKINARDASQDPSSSPYLPVVLLSHIPMYRDQGTDCGPLRERGRAIHVSRGYQYQNVLTPSLTQEVLSKVGQSVGPLAQIFSGDDHDYCDVQIPFEAPSTAWYTQGRQTASDITVKSFSWAMGVRKPGFLLVSLWNPVDANGQAVHGLSQTVQTHLCLLPDQLAIFIGYGSLLGVTILILLARAIYISLEASASDEDNISGVSLSLPRYQYDNKDERPRINARGNGFSPPSSTTPTEREPTHGRHRASSTSTATANGNSANLGVQRSFTARTRSISPIPGSAIIDNIIPKRPWAQNLLSGGEKPGVRWDATLAVPSGDDLGDVESQMGDHEDDDFHDAHEGGRLLWDSQAKWKRRPRTVETIFRVFRETFSSLLWIAIPAAITYAVLIRTG